MHIVSTKHTMKELLLSPFQGFSCLLIKVFLSCNFYVAFHVWCHFNCGSSSNIAWWNVLWFPMIPPLITVSPTNHYRYGRCEATTAKFKVLWSNENTLGPTILSVQCVRQNTVNLSWKISNATKLTALLIYLHFSAAQQFYSDLILLYSQISWGNNKIWSLVIHFNRLFHSDSSCKLIHAINYI